MEPETRTSFLDRIPPLQLAFATLVVGLAVCGGILALLLPSGGSAPARSALGGSSARYLDVSITHVAHGCHAWLVPSARNATPSATMTVRRGATVTITNNDLMPQLLIERRGPAMSLGTPDMNHMASTTSLHFVRAGTYVFGTSAGEDYVKNVVTVGPDNVLRLTVRVA